MNNKHSQNEDVEFAANEIWETLKNTVAQYAQTDKGLSFANNKKEEFCKTFINLYKSVHKQYMDAIVSELDRHKVAAITIIAAIECDIISHNGEVRGKKFLGQEMISAEVALEWMVIRFKEKLKALGLEVNEQFYHMPIAFACDTPYFEIFCRNVYFSKKEKKLSVLDIAEKLFLLEYITLLTMGIDPQELHGK